MQLYIDSENFVQKYWSVADTILLSEVNFANWDIGD